MAKGKWRVSSTYGGGEYYYQVYRIRNLDREDHSGNREVYETYYTKEAAQEVAERLNNGEQE